MGVRQHLAVAAAMVTAGAVLAISPPAMAAPVAVRQTVQQSVQQSVQQAAPVWVAPGKTVKFGAKGSVVKVLQARLKELGYLPGKIDGRYGGATQSAVWAFQKVNGIKPTSTVVARTWRALENPKLPKVLAPTGKPTRAEVNLSTQILVLYVKGQIKLISHISSGSGIPYVEYATWNGTRQQFSGDARTPTGTFKTTWRRTGWHKSYLGELYNPIFFNGGIAFHGALSVPLYPASHGCVRLPMHVAEVLPGLLGTGVPVIVRGKFQR